MRSVFAVFAALLALSLAGNCPVRKSNSKLFCYYGKLNRVGDCFCTHIVLPANSDVKAIERVKEQLNGVKILVTVNEFNQGLIDLLKSSKVDGLEIDLKKLDSKDDVGDFIATVRTKLGSDLYLALSVPSKAEILAKFFDFKRLSKQADVFILQTAFLGASKNVTFHPSRLSGMWDMQNTDSVVDLVTGLGAPLSKLVISAPVQAFQFTLQNEEYTAPGSPALEVRSLTRSQLCDTMNSGANWTLERDEDQAGPYIFNKNQWIAFEDATSIDIKAKYSRVRGLAGMALKDVSQDGGDRCGSSILETAYNGLSRQARAPRGAVLQSLEREIRETSQPLQSVHLSPYRISRVIDVEGKIHVVRQDTRTEFQCTRQGYFVHPRSCNRFYRCVKFDQLVDDFNVFEFDCPAGLAFDERVEVCVWPGSLPHGTPCAGSSEIAPVPRQRFDCPTEQGYYADPENCRWFFACIDHGKSLLTAYEFRCPFGLVFDSERLLCEWPWLVPKCGSGLNVASEYVYGGYSTSGQGGATLLEHYNGLGTLGVVKLGGINGRLEQPVTRVYSTHGSGGLGYNNGGYINQDGYIIGNGLGGLSYQAAQSLQNAGLLKSYGSGSGYQQANVLLSDANPQSNVQYHGVQGSTNVNGLGISDQYNYKSGPAFGLKSNSFGANVNTGELNGVYVSGAAQSDDSGAFGIKSSQNQLRYQSGSGFGVANGNLAANVNSEELNTVYTSTASNSDVFGAKSSQNQLQYQTGSGIGITAGNFGTKVNTEGLNTFYTSGAAQAVDSGAFGTKFSQNQPQYETGVTSGASLASNLDYNAGHEVATANTGYIQGSLNTVQLQGNTGSVGITSGTANGLGAVSSQSFTQHHEEFGGNVGDNAVVANAGQNQGDYGTLQYQENSGVGLGYSTDAFGVKLNQGQVTGPVEFAQDNAGDAFGAKSYQAITQTHTVSNGRGVAGNINIVGGGFSAVGAFKSGVEINSNGASLDTVVHATPSPISFTTVSSIPTVTSVPIPSIKTADGFESYNGGVVANVPELQYKIQGSGVANYSSAFVKFVSTTPSSVLVNEGYNYKKPVTFFNTNANSRAGADSYSYQSLDKGASASVYTGSSTGQPAVAVVRQDVLPTVSVSNSEGYVYSKPNVAFEDGQVKTVSSFSISNTAKPFNVHLQPIVQLQPTGSVAVKQPSISTYQRQDFHSGGYNYEQPTVVLKEKSGPQIVVSSTPQSQVYASPTVVPIVEQKIPVQPAVSSYSFSQNIESGGYKYERPAVALKVRPQLVVSSTPQPQVYVSSTIAPIVEQKVAVQPAVSTYSFTQDISSGGYDYPKPSVAFEERPVIQTYQKVQPAIISKVSLKKPDVVNTYHVQQQNVVQPTVSTYNYQQDYKNQGYYYKKPSVFFEGKPEPVVSTYQHQQPIVRYGAAVQPTYYQKPAVNSYAYQDIAQKAVGVYQPQTVSTYNYATPSTPKSIVLEQTVRPGVVSSYSYVAPATSAPTVAVKNIDFGGYDYPKPSVTFSEEPVPVVTSYENKQPVQEVPFVKKKAYVTGQANSYQYHQQFETPTVVESYQTSPKPSISAPVVVENYQAPISKTYSQAVDTSSSYYFNNNAVSSTPVYQQEHYSTPQVYQEYVKLSTPKPTYKSTILAAKVQPTTEAGNFYYYDSRLSSDQKTVDAGYSYPKPKSQFEEQPIRVSTTTYLPPTTEYLPVKRPISSYSFSSVDGQYQSVSTPRPFSAPTTPLSREYIPATSKVAVTPSEPSYIVPEVTYEPVRQRIRYTTNRPVEYIPATTPFTVTELPLVSSRVPIEVTTLSRDYLPVRSRLRVTSTSAPLKVTGYEGKSLSRVSIIKQNDLHPMLAAKLGAQCTCVSNTLNLRKKQKIIIVEDDDEDDDGYVVGNLGGRVVENYQYTPEDTVEITPTPQVYQSTSKQAYAVKKRVKVRPVTSESLLKSSDDPSDKEIASAVRSGLKLVKQAAREGAEEALTNYERAGVRDAIDCQRAGLFRHPTQCNKFYSCRWDCTKNKFILHTFNCPVHLTFDGSLGACNWPSQGPACLENTLLPSE